VQYNKYTVSLTQSFCFNLGSTVCWNDKCWNVKKFKTFLAFVSNSISVVSPLLLIAARQWKCDSFSGSHAWRKTSEYLLLSNKITFFVLKIGFRCPWSSNWTDRWEHNRYSYCPLMDPRIWWWTKPTIQDSLSRYIKISQTDPICRCPVNTIWTWR